MQLTLPMHRFSEFVDLSPADLAEIRQARGPSRQLAAGKVLRREGDRVEGVYVLEHGWFSSSVTVGRTAQQIVKVHLAGDILGSPSVSLTCAAETLTALTPSTVASVSLDAFGRLLQRTPKLATALFLSAQQERVILMDRLASVGRSSATARMAGFFVHLYDRQCVAGQDAQTFAMPLTQEQLGDIVGLSTVHVNRTMKELERTHLISRRHRSTLTLCDVNQLRELSGMPRREWARGPRWLSDSAAASA